MEILVALILVIFLIFWSAKNWKLAIKTVLVLVIIEGGLRRWVLPQARDIIYFLKDFIILGSYIGFFSQPRHAVDKFPIIKELVFIVAILCGLQAFNPSIGSPIVGLFGIKCYLLYVPLLWILVHLFESDLELRDFLKKYLLIIFPVCLLGIVQYFSPQDSPLNIYIAGEETQGGVALVGEYVRITGTFSYLGGLSVYLSICFSLLIVIINHERNLRWQIIFTAELTLVVINSFMSGSRGVIGYEIIFSIIYFASIFFSRPKAALNLARRLFLPILIVTVISATNFQTAINAFADRANNSDSATDRAIESVTQIFGFASTVNIEGYGVGATQPGATTLRNFLQLPNGAELPPSEGETGRVTIELGPIGFVVWYMLRILILVSLWSTFMKLKNPFYKEIVLSIFLFQLINITGQLVTNPTTNVYFWFFSGFIHLLPALEEQESNTISLNQAK